MNVPLQPDAVERFEAQMEALAPWMHAFQFGQSIYTGYFKYEHLTPPLTWVNSRSPAADVARLEQAYHRQDHTLWPAFLERLVGDIARDERARMTLLDVGAATGRNSLLAVDMEFGRVLSSEIRDNQSAQLRSILDSARDARYRERITAIHDPVSADDPRFPERYTAAGVDVVLSAGILYHLANPVQHLANLRRIARRAVIYTMTHFHPFAKRMWWLELEASEWITKATAGVSWTPHYLEVPRLCRALGFERVRIVYPEIFERNFPDYHRAARVTDLKLAAAMALDHAAGIKTGPLRNHAFDYFRHTQVNPNYFAYVCE